MVEPPAGVTEPVHWDAPLVRAPEIGYTEVDGTPVLVHTRTGEIHPLTPTWSAVWATLDGRPVRRSLGIDPDTMSLIDRRNLIEVLRRLKAQGLIVDATGESGVEGDRDVDLIAPPPIDGPVTVGVRGHTTRIDGAWTLRIEPDAPGYRRLRMIQRGADVDVDFRRRLRRRVVERVEVDYGPSRPDVEAAVEAFATIVAAVLDRTALTTPGLLDLFAGLAERATAPGSPRH